MDILGGTVARTDITLAPLDKEIHPALAEWQAGDLVRIVNLIERRDGQLIPTTSTLGYRDSECPSFQVQAQAGGAML